MSGEVVILATPVYGSVLPQLVVDRIEALGDVRVVPLSRDGVVHADAGAAMDEAEVLLRSGLPASVLDHIVARTPRLRWIHSASAGIDEVATPVLRSRQITVTNSRGVFSRPIAEYVVMMLLAIAHRLPQLIELQRERTWQPLRGRELGGLTVGILGYGSIGSEIAALLEPFGTRVLATRRHPELGVDDRRNVEIHGEDATDYVLSEADVVVLTAPLTEETAGMIGAPQLQAMRESAWLVNIARGRLVDEAALRRALESGWIAGAVLDVFNEEPLPPDSPLYDRPNLLVTPHTSWSSDRVVERGLELFIDNLRHYLAGEPLRNVVDLDAGY
jgi:phosphoglycerate dehydrogenase-like enzyme